MIEQSELQRRAAMHAALADPARLLIVDALSLGDLSPSQLQLDLGIPSNLLSHHLGVLERQGIVVRRRSEGDRRRSYVRLVRAALTELVPERTLVVPGRLLFVCTANSARSQLAAAIWPRSSAVRVASAGTHPGARIHRRAAAVARRHQLRMTSQGPRSLVDVVSDADVLITVCDKAHEELAGRAALHWSVPDPVPVGTAAAFEAAFDELSRRVEDLAVRVS